MTLDTHESFTVGGWLVQPALNRISRGEETVSLQPRSMDLLVFLARHPRKVLAKQEILEAVWEKEFVSEGTLSHAIAALRQALGDNVREPAYIETIQARGYRLIAVVVPAEGSGIHPSAGRRPGAVGRRRTLIWVLGAVVAAAATVVVWSLGGFSGGRGGDTTRIVVLPFDNLGPDARSYVASGLTDDITTRLAAMHGLGVISRHSAASSAQSGKLTRELGEELGVDFLLEGAVHWESGTEEGDAGLRVNAQLVSVREDTHRWAASYQAPVAAVFEVSAAIAGEVIRELGVSVGEPEQHRLAAQPTRDLDAYQAYLSALRYRDLESPQHLGLAAAMFERAGRLDPEFALAFAELSMVHSRIYQLRIDSKAERLALAKAAADRALELDPNLPEGRAALGTFYTLGKRDYQRALGELNFALQALPNDSALLARIAEVHRRQGEWGSAREEIERVVSLDPRNYSAVLALGDTLLYLRDYEGADRAYRQATNLMPDSIHPYLRRFWNLLYWEGETAQAAGVLEDLPPPHRRETAFYRFYVKLCDRDLEGALQELSVAPVEVVAEPIGTVPRSLLQCICYDALGDRGRAEEACGAALSSLAAAAPQRADDPRLEVEKGLAWALLGRREEALRAARRALALCPLDENALDGPTYLLEQARIAARAGDMDLAVASLEQVLSVPGYVSTRWLRLDPQLEPLRSQPSFWQLLERHM